MLSLDKILENFKNNDVLRVFFKHLALNDNSKNQPYLGSGWDIVSILPLKEIVSYPGDRRPNLKCNIDLFWLSNNGDLCKAPYSKLILYEKYPEVRLSGFIRGCSDRERLGRLMNSPRDQTPKRTMILGVTRDKRIISYVRLASDQLSNQLNDISSNNYGALTEIKYDEGEASINQLKSKISQISDKGWCRARYLVDNEGTLEPVFLGPHNNSHGMTLEAELGIPHNSNSLSDWRGWEFKAKKINNESEVSHAKPVTLMTPAPDGGLYKISFEEFIYAYGRNNNDAGMRFDFNGTHYYNAVCGATQLRLDVAGYNNGVIEPGGAIVLYDPGDNLVSSWSFETLLRIWNNKHQRFVMVPSIVRSINGNTHCRYYGTISYGVETDFPLFLKGFINNFIKYDPGCRIDPDSKVVRRERHQFRISSSNLSNLYKNFWHNVDLE